MHVLASMRSLGSRYMALWIAQTTSLIGAYFAVITVPLLVMHIQAAAGSERTLDFAISYALQTAPALIIGLLGGILLDRINLRLVMIVTNLLRACALFYLAAEVGSYGIGTVFAMAFVIGSFTTLFDSAVYTMIPSLVPKDRLSDANSFVAVSVQVTTALGPLVGGVTALIFAGPAVGLYINGVVFLISAWSLRNVGRVARHADAAAERGSFLAGFKTGIHHLWNEPRLRISTVTAAVPNFVIGFIEATFVVLAIVVLEAESGFQIAVLLFFMGAGGVIGALVAPLVSRAIGLGRAMIAGLAMSGVSLLIVTVSTYGARAMALLALFMAGISVMNVPLVTIRQVYAGEAMLGRVISAARAIGWAGLPLGALVGVWLGDFERAYLLISRLSPMLLLGCALWLFSTVIWTDTFGPGYRTDSREAQKETKRQAVETAGEVVKLGRDRRQARAWPFFLIAIALVFWWNAKAGAGVIVIGVYGMLAISYLLLKMVLASRYEPWFDPAPDMSVAVFVPVYNEDPLVFRECLRSLLNQTRIPQEIWVVDDGSDDATCIAIAARHLKNHGGRVHRFRENRGKRHAQAWAFARSKADVFVTVDSDTVLDRACIDEGLRSFFDSEVSAVCGNVRALNAKKNLLTRLIDLRYSNAFTYERAAYSVLDSMLCATGIITLYRASIVRRYLDDYVSQRFLGVEVSYGDDRRLTNYALRHGRVVFQETAKAMTLAPDRLSHFLRQQLRWNRSFFRETVWAIFHQKRARVTALAVSELGLWLFFSAAIMMAIVVRPIMAGQFVGYYYLGFITLMSYVRSARHVDVSFLTFLLSPLYGIIHILLLTPLRLWALLTLRKQDWGTRADGVEIGWKKPAARVTDSPVGIEVPVSPA